MIALPMLQTFATLGWSAVAAAVADRLRPELAPAAPRRRLLTFGLAGAAGAAALVLAGPAAGVACGGLTAAAVLDAQSGYLVDELTLPAAALAFGFATFAGGPASAICAMAELSLPAALLAAWSREAWLGWGDVKAFLALGAGLGVTHALVALGAACCSGSAWALVRKRRAIRFGPHIAAGALLALGVPS